MLKRAKEQANIEKVIDDFLDKNNGNCFLCFFSAKDLKAKMPIKDLRTLIKDSIEFVNFKTKDNILKPSKDNVLLFDCDNYTFAEELLLEEFEQSSLPFIFRTEEFEVIGGTDVLVAIKNVEE